MVWPVVPKIRVPEHSKEDTSFAMTLNQSNSIALSYWQSSPRDYYSRQQGYFQMYPTLPQGLPRYSTIFPEDQAQMCKRHPGSQTSNKRPPKKEAQECSNLDAESKRTQEGLEDTNPGAPAQKMAWEN